MQQKTVKHNLTGYFQSQQQKCFRPLNKGDHSINYLIFFPPLLTPLLFQP